MGEVWFRLLAAAVAFLAAIGIAKAVLRRRGALLRWEGVLLLFVATATLTLGEDLGVRLAPAHPHLAAFALNAVVVTILLGYAVWRGK